MELVVAMGTVSRAGHSDIDLVVSSDLLIVMFFGATAPVGPRPPY